MNQTEEYSIKRQVKDLSLQQNQESEQAYSGILLVHTYTAFLLERG